MTDILSILRSSACIRAVEELDTSHEDINQDAEEEFDINQQAIYIYQSSEEEIGQEESDQNLAEDIESLLSSMEMDPEYAEYVGNEVLNSPSLRVFIDSNSDNGPVVFCGQELIDNNYLYVYRTRMLRADENYFTPEHPFFPSDGTPEISYLAIQDYDDNISRLQSEHKILTLDTERERSSATMPLNPCIGEAYLLNFSDAEMFNLMKSDPSGKFTKINPNTLYCVNAPYHLRNSFYFSR